LFFGLYSINYYASQFMPEGDWNALLLAGALIMAILGGLSGLNDAFDLVEKLFNRKKQVLPEKKSLDISVYQPRWANVYVCSSKRPILWAVMLTVHNETAEQIFFSGLNMKLVFIQSFSAHPFRWSLLYDLSRGSLDIRQYFEYSFTALVPSYIGQRIVGTIPGVVRMDSYTSLQEVVAFNWETKDPIQFYKNNQMRSPLPGEKEIWILAGKISPEIYENIIENKMKFTSIICKFYTDVGEIIVDISMSSAGHTDSELRAAIEAHFVAQ
jgi:hypothetical protein